MYNNDVNIKDLCMKLFFSIFHRLIMPTTTISENNEQSQSILKNNDNQIKSDVGANIVLIGAPGSGKYLFFVFSKI